MAILKMVCDRSETRARDEVGNGFGGFEERDGACLIGSVRDFLPGTRNGWVMNLMMMMMMMLFFFRVGFVCLC